MAITALQTISGEMISQSLNDNFSYVAEEVNAHLADYAIDVLNPGNGLTAPKGDGLTDDTIAIQAILDYAAANSMGVYFPPNYTYLVTSIRIKNGTKCFICDGIIKGTGATASNAIIEMDGANLFGGTPVDNCYVQSNIDMSNGDGFGIKADGCTNCIFERNHIYGMTDNTLASRFGLYLYIGSSYNIISKNKIEGFQNRTNPALAVVSIAIFGDGEEYGGYFDGGGFVEPITPCIGNTVTENILLYGEVGIDLLSNVNATVTNNFLYKHNTRAIYLSKSIKESIIDGNIVIGYGASGVACTYNAYDVTISNNIFKQLLGINPLYGEAAINVSVGVDNIKITNNTIYHIGHYGVYLAVAVTNCVVKNNKISGYYISAIALENDFQDTPPANAIYSRPNYVAPLIGDAWALYDSENNVIEGNVIGESYVGRQIGSIYLSQLGTTKNMNNVIQNNSMIHIQQANNFPLYFFEETPDSMIKNKLVNNRIKDGVMTRLFFSRGRSHFDTCFGNDIMDFGSSFFAAEDTTPSVGKGKRFKFNNTVATVVTMFDDGIDGQEIQIKLDANTTIAYAGALIFTKGSANIVGSAAINEWVTFIKDGTSWRELSRSF